MNKKFRDIATLYELSPELSEAILVGIKIENPTKNPSKVQLEAFDRVCQLLKKGISQQEAIAKILAENKVSPVVKENAPSQTVTEKPKEEKVNQDSVNKQTNKQTESQGSQAQAHENPSMDSITTEIAKEVAHAMYENVPGIAQTKFLEMKGKLETGIEKFFVKDVLGGDFKKNFENFVNTDVENFKQGKLKSQKDNSALPPGN